MQNNSAYIKVIFLGDAGVGKSSLILRLATDKLEHPEASFLGKNLWVNDKMIKFNLWDPHGKEWYHTLAKMYYKDATAAIMVYDITNRNSFEGLKRWHKEIQDFEPKDIIVTIVGNKADLFESEVIPEEEAKEYAESIGALYRKTSAKTSYGVEQVLHDIALKMCLENQTPQAKRGAKMIQLGKPASGKKKMCWCW